MGRPRKLTPEQAKTIVPELPPPGAERAEVLAANKDQLAEFMETETPDRYRFDPSRFKVENEIASALQGSAQNIKNAQPDRKYIWERFRDPSPQVDLRQSQTVIDTQTGERCQVWHVVQGDDPEAPERKDVRGYRVIGDVLLMWAKREHADAWDHYEQEKAARYVRDPAGERAYEDKVRHAGMQTRSAILADPNDSITQQEMVRHMLGQRYDKALREGTVGR